MPLCPASGVEPEIGVSRALSRVPPPISGARLCALLADQEDGVREVWRYNRGGVAEEGDSMNPRAFIQTMIALASASLGLVAVLA